MLKKVSALFIGMFLLLLNAQPVLAQYGLNETAEKAGLKGAIKSGSIAELIGNVVGAALTMVGVLFLILMLYGGIIWMMARGNETETDKALKTIKAAIIGLIIVVASYAITNFVFQAIEGGPETEGGLADVCSDGVICSTDTDCPGGTCWSPTCEGTGGVCTIVGGTGECATGAECVAVSRCIC